MRSQKYWVALLRIPFVESSDHGACFFGTCHWERRRAVPDNVLELVLGPISDHSWHTHIT